MDTNALPVDCPRSDVDLWSEKILADPYPAFKKLRDLGPVVWLKRQRVAALPRYSDVRSALRNWGMYSSAQGIGIEPVINKAPGEQINVSDPPAHTEYRRPVAAQLSRRALNSESARIEQVAGSLADSVAERGMFDAVNDLALPYSLTIVCDMLGILEDDQRQLPELSEQAFNIFGPANEHFAKAPAALRRIFARARALAEPGKLRPGGKGAELAGPRAADHLVSYLWPGIHTTIDAVSTAVYLFARHPGQWDLVREDPTLIAGALHEVLRLHAPIQYFTRITTEAVAIDGVDIPSATRILLMYGSANRDERHYPDPDRFDVTRNPSDQLAFGHGVHTCVGMPLAQMEAHALLAALALRVTKFELNGEPKWMINNTLHGFRELPVSALAR